MHLEILGTLNTEELRSFGIKLGHIKQIKAALEALEKTAVEAGLKKREKEQEAEEEEAAVKAEEDRKKREEKEKVKREAAAREATEHRKREKEKREATAKAEAQRKKQEEEKEQVKREAAAREEAERRKREEETAVDEHPSLRAFLNSTGHEQYHSVPEQDAITVGTHHLYFLGPCNPLAVI